MLINRRIRSAREDAANEAEAGLLLDACNSVLDYLVVALPLYTGMRIGGLDCTPMTGQVGLGECGGALR